MSVILVFCFYGRELCEPEQGSRWAFGREVLTASLFDVMDLSISSAGAVYMSVYHFDGEAIVGD